VGGGTKVTTKFRRIIRNVNLKNFINLPTFHYLTLHYAGLFKILNYLFCYFMGDIFFGVGGVGYSNSHLNPPHLTEE
jgi:hypothetical protein